MYYLVKLGNRRSLIQNKKYHIIKAWTKRGAIRKIAKQYKENSDFAIDYAIRLSRKGLKKYYVSMDDKRY